MSTSPLTKLVLGSCPIATKAPPASSTRSSPPERTRTRRSTLCSSAASSAPSLSAARSRRTRSSLSTTEAVSTAAASRRALSSLTRSLAKSSSTTRPSPSSSTVRPLGSTLTRLPSKATTCEFHSTVIFAWPSTRSASTLVARNDSPRCTTVTALDVRASTRASSMAVSPPPMTTTALLVYMNPSHVAHAETPLPLKSHSPGTPSQRESAPVARMTLCARIRLWLVRTVIGLERRSTERTRSCSKMVPNSAACFCMSKTMSGPVVPLTPG
mmetsp:Transcript_33837/g.84323  ORF Transcript_33837/g.84323 Transcript_33837/m.84323 type:complete len:270 (+) Transcript_33837:385-1194(+)